jgi:hypothetical protein
MEAAGADRPPTAPAPARPPLARRVVRDRFDSGQDGHGVGGGVYNLGTITFDVTTIIMNNHASTSNDDLFA